MANEPAAASDATRGQIRCVVVTPEKAILDTTALMAVLPMYDGELGVLPGRAPLIGRLGAGELRLKSATQETRYFVEPGFVQIRANVVTVLTGKAQKAEEITPAMADAASLAAEAMPFETAVDRTNKTKARDRAQGMKKVAAKNSGSGSR